MKARASHPRTLPHRGTAAKADQHGPKLCPPPRHLLIEPLKCSVTGHDFGRAANAPKQTRALSIAEKLVRAVGRDFSPGISRTGCAWPLGPEVCISSSSFKGIPFSTACLALERFISSARPAIGAVSQPAYPCFIFVSSRGLALDLRKFNLINHPQRSHPCLQLEKSSPHST